MSDHALLMLAVLVNLAITVVNVGLLSTFIKLYTEVLKIGHIKNIGRATPESRN